MIAILFETQRVYGKEPEQLKSLVLLFQMTLADYNWQQVEGAFKVFVTRSNEMPTPFDVVDLIERGGKPPLERALYIGIQKKDACDRTSAEWDYMKDYEHFNLTGKHRKQF